MGLTETFLASNTMRFSAGGVDFEVCRLTTAEMLAVRGGVPRLKNDPDRKEAPTPEEETAFMRSVVTASLKSPRLCKNGSVPADDELSYEAIPFGLANRIMMFALSDVVSGQEDSALRGIL